jgi:prepilin-type N-terminal cleavage/methylation domain-containing protein
MKKAFSQHGVFRLAQKGFSLVEALVVIAVIGIVSALVLPQVMNVQRSASVSLGRQQQAELQTALGNWIVAKSSGPGGLAAARNSYNSAGTKLGLLQNYLQEGTYAALSGSGSKVTSAALTASGASLQFSSWSVGGSPSVTWANSP